MIKLALVAVVVLVASPASAGCGFIGLFPCRYFHHSHHYHRPRIVHKIVVHKTIVKKIVIVHERKVHAPTVDRTPIAPLK